MRHFDQKGMTLIEVLVTASLLAVVGLITSMMMIDSNRNAQGLHQKVEFTNYVALLQDYIRENPEACRKIGLLKDKPNAVALPDLGEICQLAEKSGKNCALSSHPRPADRELASLVNETLPEIFKKKELPIEMKIPGVEPFGLGFAVDPGSVAYRDPATPKDVDFGDGADDERLLKFSANMQLSFTRNTKSAVGGSLPTVDLPFAFDIDEDRNIVSCRFMGGARGISSEKSGSTRCQPGQVLVGMSGSSAICEPETPCAEGEFLQRKGSVWGCGNPTGPSTTTIISEVVPTPKPKPKPPAAQYVYAGKDNGIDTAICPTGYHVAECTFSLNCDKTNKMWGGCSADARDKKMCSIVAKCIK